MKQTFYIIFAIALLLGNTSYAANDWEWSCKVKTAACVEYCELMRKNEFSPVDHVNLAVKCASDKSGFAETKK